MSRSVRLVMIAAVMAILAGVFIAAVSGDEEVGSRSLSFAEVGRAAGVEHVYDGEFAFFVGGGVAAFDCDSDGLDDLYFAGGSNPAALYRNDSEPGGSLRFTHQPHPLTDLDRVVGAYPLDIDSDTQPDLVVLRHGENVVLRGLGDCRFEDAMRSWDVDGGHVWTTAFSATWEHNEQLPTMAFGNYLELDDAGNRTGNCWDNALIRPDEDGYGDPTTLRPGYCSLSMLFSDWDRSGVADLRVSNDRQYYRDGEEQLWRLPPGEEPVLYSRADGWKQLQIFGMGIASHDVTGDGFPDVFLTSMGDNKLQTLNDGADQPDYADIALDRGVTAHRPFVGDNVLPSTAWHAEFEDVDNDGIIDLFITKGNVDAMVEAAADDPNNLLLGQTDGTFAENANHAGIVSDARARGAAVVDLNLDGWLDIVEVTRREPAKIWHNTTNVRPAPGWIQVQLRQQSTNSHGVGAWVEVTSNGTTVRKEVTVGGGHASGQLGWIHFGLGPATQADITVHWPDGDIFGPTSLDAGSFAIIERGTPSPQLWLPGQPVD